MNKPIVLRTADIYLRFPEIMEEECNDLAEFLEDEHIVYEGATDVFIEKDKEIKRLNNIINRMEEDLKEMYMTFGEFNEEYTEKKIRELKEGKEWKRE